MRYAYDWNKWPIGARRPGVVQFIGRLLRRLEDVTHIVAEGRIFIFVLNVTEDGTEHDLIVDGVLDHISPPYLERQLKWQMHSAPNAFVEGAYPLRFRYNSAHHNGLFDPSYQDPLNLP
ncbi:MAG: hypothetical protein ACTJG2_01680 [Candidatus Saccharimonadales bacterium]